MATLPITLVPDPSKADGQGSGSSTVDATARAAAAAAQSTANTAQSTASTAQSTATGAAATASSAQSSADSAFSLAQTGTVTAYGTFPPASGSIVFDMAGSAWQESSVSGHAYITAANLAAASTTIRTVTGRIYCADTGTYNLTWGAYFKWFGTTPPPQLYPGKEVLVSLACFANTVNGVTATTIVQV